MQPIRSRSNPAPWAGIIFGILFLTVWFWTPIVNTFHGWCPDDAVPVVKPYSFELQQAGLNMILSPDGNFIASAGEKEFALWDIHSRKIVTRIALEQEIESINYTHDGKNLILVTDDSVDLWDTRRWTITQSYKNSPFDGAGELIRLSAPSDEHLIAAILDEHNKYVNVYDAMAKKNLLRIGAEYKSQLCFDSASHLLAGYSRKPSNIAVWNLKSGEQEDTIPAEEFSGVLRISPNGRFVAWSARGRVMLYDRITKNYKTFFHDMPHRLPLAAFSADSSRIAVTERDGIRLYDTASGKTIALLSSSSSDYQSLSFSHDGKTLAVNYGFGSLVDIWDLKNIL